MFAGERGWTHGGRAAVHDGFNEAPACLPGKAAHHPHGDLPLRKASMRPRHVCRGKDVALAKSLRRRNRFNEAPACLPGKGVSRRPLSTQYDELQ